MIIGFLGKGGSGKTTLSTAMVRFLHSDKNTVLAIDADHNMDLTYNLGVTIPFPYLGEAMPYIKENLGIQGHYRDYFTSIKEIHSDKDKQKTYSKFSISRENTDFFTKKFSISIEDGLRLMSAGPHTDNVLYGNKCSHSLSTPLRTYLPLVDLKEYEYIIVDEKAGRDGVGTGTPSGFDIAYISAEPTIYGMKAASQIAEILDFLETPYEFVINKAEPEHISDTWIQWKDFLNKKPILKIPKISSENVLYNDPDKNNKNEYYPYMEILKDHAKDILSKTSIENQRLKRSIRKFEKQKGFVEKYINTL